MNSSFFIQFCCTSHRSHNFLKFVFFCVKVTMQLFTLFLVVIVMATTPDSLAENPDATVQRLTDGISTTSNNFYTTLRSIIKEENLIYSPLSLSTCFALLKVGTRGETAKELQTALNYPEDDNELCSGYQRIFQSLNKVERMPTLPHQYFGDPDSDSENFRLVSANRLYVDEQFKLRETYEQMLRTYFDGEKVTRTKLDRAAAVEINEWVKNVTQGKIVDFVEPDSFDLAPQKLVLVNAVYFKALWKRQFDKMDTRPGDFYLSDKEGDKISVPTMHIDGFSRQGMELQLTFLEELDADVFALPYRGDRFSMLIYLPKTKSGLEKIEKNLQTLPKLSKIFETMEEKSYRLSIPKFKIESSLDLNPVLKNMGIKKIFGSDGDFSGMLAEENQQGFAVSKAIQKAAIIVDEKGTEAAAATGIMGLGASPFMPPPAPLLAVDHPFYFQIVDKQENLVLFAGSCSRPASPN